MTTAERHRLLQKRRKLAALAERGVDGERTVAQQKLLEFDQKHPGLIPGQLPSGTLNVNGHEITKEQFEKLVKDAMMFTIKVYFNRR